MIELIEEAEGDPILKEELLKEIAFRRKKEEEELKQRTRFTRVIPKGTVDIDGYEDYDERVRIFKKRLAILIKSDNIK